MTLELAKNINKIKDYQNYLFTLDGEEGYNVAAKIVKGNDIKENINMVKNLTMTVLNNAPFIGPYLGDINDNIKGLASKGIEVIAGKMGNFANHLPLKKYSEDFGEFVDKCYGSIDEKISDFVINKVIEKKGLTEDQILDGILTVVNDQIDKYNEEHPENKINHLPKIEELKEMMNQGLKEAISKEGIEFGFKGEKSIFKRENNIAKEWDCEDVEVFKKKEKLVIIIY